MLIGIYLHLVSHLCHLFASHSCSLRLNLRLCFRVQALHRSTPSNGHLSLSDCCATRPQRVWLQFACATFALTFAADCSTLSRIIGIYLHEHGLQQKSSPNFGTFTHSASNFVFPLGRLADALQFERTRFSQLCSGLSSTDRMSHNEFAGISARGLAEVCVQTGHSKQLFALASESSHYSCLLRSLLRFLSTASPSASQHSTGLSLIWCADGPWVKESEVLRLFGLDNVTHPERLIQPVLQLGIPTHRVRTYCDVSVQPPQILHTCMRASHDRVIVLSMAGAHAYIHELLSRSFALSTPMGTGLVRAASQFVSEVAEAENARVHLRDLAVLLSELNAQTLHALTLDECLDGALTSSLAKLSAELGSIVRVRCASMASDAVSKQSTELTSARLAKFDNSTYISSHTEPVSRQFLESALGCGHVQQEFRDSHLFSSAMENLRTTEHTENSRESALITCSDCLLKSTNSAFVAPRSLLIGRDILNTCGACVLFVGSMFTCCRVSACG